MESLRFQIKQNIFEEYMPNNGNKIWGPNYYSVHSTDSDSKQKVNRTRSLPVPVRSRKVSPTENNDFDQGNFLGAKFYNNKAYGATYHEFEILLEQNTDQEVESQNTDVNKISYQGSNENTDDHKSTDQNKLEKTDPKDKQVNTQTRRKTSITVNGKFVNFPLQTLPVEDLSTIKPSEHSQLKYVDIDFGEGKQNIEKIDQSDNKFQTVVENKTEFQVDDITQQELNKNKKDSLEVETSTICNQNQQNLKLENISIESYDYIGYNKYQENLNASNDINEYQPNQQQGNLNLNQLKNFDKRETSEGVQTNQSFFSNENILKHNTTYYESPQFVNLDTVEKQQLNETNDLKKKDLDYQSSNFEKTYKRRRSLSEGNLPDKFNLPITPHNSRSENSIFNAELYETEIDFSSGTDTDADDELEISNLFENKPRSPRKKKHSFIGQSISVDLVTNDHGFSSSKNRRKGLTAERFNSNSESDDFLTDLLEFKKNYKQEKKRQSTGLRFARSVENLLKIDKLTDGHAKPLRKRSSTETKETKISSVKKRPNFLGKRFFASKHKTMNEIRETNLLDDDDDYEFQNGQKPNISIVGRVQKVAGIIEMYLDQHGDVIRKIEIQKVPGLSLGFFIRFGNGIERDNGIFISRVTLGSFVDVNNLLHAGDEIITINKVDITGQTLEEVATMMQLAESLVIKTRSALPLPLHARPLFTTFESTSFDLGKEDYGNKNSNVGGEFVKPGDVNYGEENRNFMQHTRTASDPYVLSDTSDEDTHKTRGRSLSDDLSGQEKDKLIDRRANLLRQKNKSQNDMYARHNINATQKSPLLNRCLPVIPDGKIPIIKDDVDNSKGFSRAQKYQNKVVFVDDVREIAKPSKTSFMKSPKFFRKADSKIKLSNHAKTLALSPLQPNDSLSSTSDTELSPTRQSPPTGLLPASTDVEKTQIYQSDSTTSGSKFTKGYNGKLTVHILKLFGRLSSNDGDCYCTIEVDSEYKATTQPRPIKDVVEFDENFEIEIRNSCVLMFNIYHKQQKRQHKLLSQACIHLEKLNAGENKVQLLLTTTNHVQIRVGIEFTEAGNFLKRTPSSRSKGVFGFNLSKTLVTEENTVPILVRKCVAEIEKRGLDLVGIYRISGNARKKKLLRMEFEEDGLNANVSDPDCHVITGILKDYLRELPNPLISQETYLNIYNKSLEKNTDEKSFQKLLIELMKKLPYTNRATLIYIMEHLQRVEEHKEVNKMDYKNMAVCFGPVLMCPPITKSSSVADMFDFKKQIQALEFLLTIWPTRSKQNGV